MSAIRHELPAVVRVPLQAAERIEWHYHDGSQLIYPGRGVLQVFTHAGSWIVPPLRGVWIPAGVPHSHRARGRTELLSVAFDAAVDPFGDERPTVVEISPLLREVVLALTADDPPAGTRTLLRRLLLDQLRRVAILPLALPRPRDDRLLPIVEQLSGDPSDRRTLAQFGHEVGASERTLSRLFRRETGMSFPQWRAQLRLQHAQLLLAGGESVTATAHACGYRSTSAFIEAFRTAFGSTPRNLIAGNARGRPPSPAQQGPSHRIVGAKSQLLGAGGRLLGQLDGSGAPMPGARGVDGVHATT